MHVESCLNIFLYNFKQYFLTYCSHRPVYLTWPLYFTTIQGRRRCMKAFSCENAFADHFPINAFKSTIYIFLCSFLIITFASLCVWDLGHSKFFPSSHPSPHNMWASTWESVTGATEDCHAKSPALPLFYRNGIRWTWRWRFRWRFRSQFWPRYWRFLWSRWYWPRYRLVQQLCCCCFWQISIYFPICVL